MTSPDDVVRCAVLRDLAASHVEAVLSADWPRVYARYACEVFYLGPGRTYRGRDAVTEHLRSVLRDRAGAAFSIDRVLDDGNSSVAVSWTLDPAVEAMTVYDFWCDEISRHRDYWAAPWESPLRGREREECISRPVDVVWRGWPGGAGWLEPSTRPPGGAVLATPRSPSPR